MCNPRLRSPKCGIIAYIYFRGRNMMRVTKFYEIMKVGTTQPVRVETEAHKQYVMKYIHDEYDGKFLFNELVAGRLAKLIGLPIPDFEVGQLTTSLIEETTELKEVGAIRGSVFLSEYRKGITLTNAKMLERVQNNSDFGGIVFFDQLVNNSDRGENTGNWFVDRDTKKLMMLDHTHVFRIGQLWNAISLKQDAVIPHPLLPEFSGSLYRLLLDHISVSSPFYSVSARWKHLTRQDVVGVLNGIPEDWNITDDELSAMRGFLIFQHEHANDLENVLQVGLNWKGKA